MLRVDSRKVEPGDTFLALVGSYTDGHDYINDAIDRGAACIIANHGEYSVKTIITDDTRTYLSNYLKELNLLYLYLLYFHFLQQLIHRHFLKIKYR